MKNEGFTLVELLIALLVLTAALLPMSLTVVSVMRATSQTKGMAAATTLVQDKMENLRNSPFGSLVSGSDSVAAGSITYFRQWMVSTSGNLKTITVTVNWSDFAPHQVSLTTLRGT